jgi:hypothetical protein
MVAGRAEKGTTGLEHTATDRARRTSRQPLRSDSDSDTPDLCGDGGECDKREASRAEKKRRR